MIQITATLSAADEENPQLPVRVSYFLLHSQVGFGTNREEEHLNSVELSMIQDVSRRATGGSLPRKPGVWWGRGMSLFVTDRNGERMQAHV